MLNGVNVTDDEKETVTAEFHRPYIISTNERRDSTEGMSILDYIIGTFLFVEQKHDYRARALCGPTPFYLAICIFVYIIYYAPSHHPHASTPYSRQIFS